MRVLVLNGPNLGRLGSREPEVYGLLDHVELVRRCRAWGADLGLDTDVRQTDDEAELVRWIHEAVDAGAAVVLNPAAFTHYSYALRDACAQLSTPLVEVHLSNPAAREAFRHTSVISGVATGTVAGFGVDSYRLALSAVARVTSDVIGLGAWCDYVTADEYREELREQAARPADPDEADDPDDPNSAEPRPAAWRPNPEEIEAEVRNFGRGVSFRVVTFATLADGSRATLDERGWSTSGPPVPQIWAEMSLERLERDVRDVALPDDEDPWGDLTERLHSRGVAASGRDLQDLPFSIELSERLRVRLGEPNE